MVIILAALLCILICALALNSLLRCARHCLAAAPAAATTTTITTVVVAAAAVSGLDKTELRKIPVVEYETSKDGGGGGVHDDDTSTECAICLGEFVDGEKVRLLPRCRHGFHVGCIDAWLAAHSSCPICRNSLLLEEDDHHHGAAGEATTVAGEAT
ncbi:hypothetical protein PR202_gb16597 [Eleusine coracana subsp. coracana]|uniref:RING-type E3 ubiquitin transferase n=1 Tax=Eleusine coracana subsp. coracana TaxID=191504 RepID=A0AAV5EYH7_ELECO|nr:hypothetical protein PR202_gb16597 [Eleusine coracana subsp. coracana]